MTRIGVGLIGFGWLGQAHSRSIARIPTLFGDRGFDAELVVCADTLPERLEDAVAYLGDRSAELRVCRIAAVHLAVQDLAAKLVIVVPAQKLAELPHALNDVGVGQARLDHQDVGAFRLV